MQVKSKSVLSAKSAQQKQPQPNNLSSKLNLLNIFLFLFIVVGSLFIIKQESVNKKLLPKNKFAEILNKSGPTPFPTTIPTPSPSPSPRPLTFSEMNELYGPCVRLPVLMYHHIQSKEAATAAKQTGLSVFTDIFQTQMSYLQSKNYNVLGMNDLIGFFDNGTPIPAKGVLLTFDDGYQDFYTDAYPILSGFGFKSTMFIPTGLMENPGYLNWSQLSGMNGLVLFANHTWSHKSVLTQSMVMQKEISTADTQLAEHGLNMPKVFAYPYGPDNITAENYLNSINYKLAFTTKPGSILCKKQRFNLPRLRIGNIPLSYYGF